MDGYNEVNDTDRAETPSLIGSSIRDSSDTIPTLKSLSSKQPHNHNHLVYKATDSTADLVSVDQIKEEGALLNDDIDVPLVDVLDNDGHIKNDAIPDVIKMKEDQTKATPLSTIELNNINQKEDNIHDIKKISILGGNAEQYIVPASGVASNYKYQTKKKNGKHSELEHDAREFIEPDNMRSVDDIINVVNQGEFEKATTLVDDKIADIICPPAKALTLDEISDKKADPQVPLYSIETDSSFTAPAAMREGSESILLEEQKSRSSSRRPDLSNQDSFSRPNLARGESIHSGLNGENAITETYDKSSNSLVSERRPRHDPSAPKIASSSSLSYLRSISRSRSRVSKERKSFTNDDRLESIDLRKSGALINDDEMSNAPDIEYAVNKALDFVEDTHSVKYGKKISKSNDIVKDLQKGLAEVAEEEDASNRTTLSTSDLLDQLANTALQLMDVDEEDEDEYEGDNTKKDDTAIDEEAGEGANEEVNEEVSGESKEEKSKEEEPKEEKKEEKKEEQKDDGIESSITEDAKNVLEPEEEEEKVEEAPAEEKFNASEHEKLLPAKEILEEANDQDVKNNDDDTTSEPKIETEEKSKKIENLESNEHVQKEVVNADNDIVDPVVQVHKEVEPEQAKDETKSITSEEIKEPETEPLSPKEIKTSVSETESFVNVLPDVSPVVGKQTTESAKTEDDISGFVEIKNESPVNDVEHVSKLSESKEEIEEIEKVHDEHVENQSKEELESDKEKKGEEEEKEEEHQLEEEPVSIPKEDNIDALIAAAAREKALQDSNTHLGKDGSVHVPKVTKMTFEDEPVYLYTSFAGGFHVATRTNRLETILTANRIKFEYCDLGTNPEAKNVWKRYSGGKTLPGIVRGKDDFIGNWEDIEEANEDYRVKSLIYESY